MEDFGNPPTIVQAPRGPRKQQYPLQEYRDRSDVEKIGFIAEAIRTVEQTGSLPYAPSDLCWIITTLQSFDIDAARAVIGFGAIAPMFNGNLNYDVLARLLESRPSGTFHDDGLCRDFQLMKARSNWKRLEGLEVTRRIQVALGYFEGHPALQPEPLSATSAPPDRPDIDRMLDEWVEVWMQLIAELRAARDEIDDTLRARSQQAQNLAAMHGDGRGVMNLDDPWGEGQFRRTRLVHFNGQHELRTFDQAWLARRREHIAGWRKLGPMDDWTRSDIPNARILAEAEKASGYVIADFLRSLRAAKPSAKWLKAASAIAASPGGPAVRCAIIDWLRTLAVPGSASVRARLWPVAGSYLWFRYKIVSDTRQYGGAEAAAVVHLFGSGAPFAIWHDGSGNFVAPGPDPAFLSEAADILMRGAVWMLVNWRDAETVEILQKTAGLVLVKVAMGSTGTEYRSLIVANACINVLGEIATPEAVQALGRIKLKVRDERLNKQIAKAMDEAAKRAGVTVADLQEMAVPTFDLEEVGVLAVPLGEFTATLRVISTTDVAVELIRADGKPVKAVPAAIKTDAAASAALKQLRDTAKSIAQALPVHRQRIETVYLTYRSWSLRVWRERYLDHPLIGTLARRLIWTVTASDGTARALMWHDGALVDAQDRPAGVLADDHIVTLWHPIEVAPQDVAAWRLFLMRHKLVQPFKQAHRELYPLTDAERATEIYSNRFAGHILRQHQSVALARLRGWRATLRIAADVPNDDPTHMRVPDFALTGEFWTEKAGGDDAEWTDGMAYVFISTDRVLFRQLVPAEAAPGGMPGTAVRLDQVPPRIFSEVMRDVDLLVGVASIGNDPTWNDGGADALHPSQWRRGAAQDYWNRHSAAELEVAGQHRRQFLSELIPSLKIASVCTLEDKYLTVRGKIRIYRIHLGSGNILMENDRYLCIVPKSAQSDSLDAHLPFEGDRMLSIILSKAVMLAADDKIKDASILSQLKRS